ncbi:unnamed protein product [marine sediment metagenome]|uniref:Uncharacterized protein n=1 Tax=marine sediment metagenome TaxID=412755 RepID=X0TGX8_9ZZZZ
MSNKWKEQKMLEKLPKAKVKLPKHLDVLLHLPEDRMQKGILFCVATALQYNISATGSWPGEALEKVVQLVIDHCNESVERGITPISIAESAYLIAFAIASPLPDSYADVHARVELDLARYLDCPDVWIRSICERQQRTKVYNMKELVKQPI